MSESRDFIVPECGRAMAHGGMPGHGRFRMPMGLAGLFQGLPRMLVPGQVLLLAVLLLRDAMGVRGDIVQFGGALVIFVMRSVVITSRHSF
jgi:hypothetical protein